MGLGRVEDAWTKGYATIDRHGMWQMLRVYGLGGKLLKAGAEFLCR